MLPRTDGSNKQGGRVPQQLLTILRAKAKLLHVGCLASA